VRCATRQQQQQHLPLCPKTKTKTKTRCATHFCCCTCFLSSLVGPVSPPAIQDNLRSSGMVAGEGGGPPFPAVRCVLRGAPWPCTSTHKRSVIRVRVGDGRTKQANSSARARPCAPPARWACGAPPLLSRPPAPPARWDARRGGPASSCAMSAPQAPLRPPPAPPPVWTL